MRLYYRNWVAVWRTYKYFTRFIPLMLPIIWLFCTYWIASGVILLIWGICWYIFYKKLKKFNEIRFLVPGLFDYRLTPHFGEMLPFDDE